MVEDEAVARMLATSDSSEQACRELVSCALENGGNDNITVVLARYSIPES
jgi:protein phosphatase